MALPPILSSGKHADLLGKSESEVFEIIEYAVTLAALRWPKELQAQKHRLLKPFFSKCKALTPVACDDDDCGDGYITSAVSDHEAEEDPTKVNICFEVRMYQNASTPVGKSGSSDDETVPLSGDEYEKKLENSKRKLREGYNQYTDSRKRSTVIAYIPPLESNHHDRLSNRLFDLKKSASTRRNGQNPNRGGRSTLLGRC